LRAVSLTPRQGLNDALWELIGSVSSRRNRARRGACFRQKAHGQQRAAHLGLDEEVGLGILHAALSASVMLHRLVVPPNLRGALAFVDVDNLLLELPYLFDIEVKLRLERETLGAGLDLVEVEVPASRALLVPSPDELILTPVCSPA
jgi:hypothetical protein